MSYLWAGETSPDLQIEAVMIKLINYPFIHKISVHSRIITNLCYDPVRYPQHRFVVWTYLPDTPQISELQFAHRRGTRCKKKAKSLGKS